jgi:hypothetical protein
MSYLNGERNNSDDDEGISVGNKIFLTGTFFFLLLMLGPIGPYGIIGRSTYLILVPLIFWFTLSYFGRDWSGGKKRNDRLHRAILGCFAGALFVLCYLAFTAKTHSECTDEVRTRDGWECLGDSVVVPGRDMEQSVILLLFGAVSLKFAVSENKPS